MTTALDFIALGVVFEQVGDQVALRAGPVGRTDLLEQLRAEVARRIPLVTGELPARAPGGGLCLCGDETDLDVCELCQLARRKAAEQRQATAAEPGTKRSKKSREVVVRDPWLAVESECPAGLPRAAHAGRLHVLEHDRGVACIAWRPLIVGERASDVWIEASRHRVRTVDNERIAGVDYERMSWPLEVPGAEEALYPAPTLMRFRLDVGSWLDDLAEANGAALRAFYAARRVAVVARAPCTPMGAPAHAPAPVRRLRVPVLARVA